MRLFVLLRHAESTLNHEHRINGDPSVHVGLTEGGATQARLLGFKLAESHSTLPCTHVSAARA